MTEQEKLFDRVNFNSTFLDKSIGEAYKSNDTEKCIDKLIDHFRNRTSPKYFFTAGDLKKINDPDIIKDADDVMRHFIYGYDLGKEINWHHNPTENAQADKEWSWSLFRHIYWQNLARAYAITGDEKYAVEFISQFKGFAKAWPYDPAIGEDPLFGNSGGFPGHAWRTIESGIRIYTSWLPCLVAFRNSPAWDREAWIIFLNMIHDHAEFLSKRYSNHERSSNWLTMEATALFQMGLMFPEMKNAEDWKALGYKRVMHETKYSFDNDGVHMERTPIYHMTAATSFLQAYRLCKLNDIPVPPYALPSLVKSGDYLMKLVKPDFTTPMTGDADKNDLLARRSDEPTLYEGMNLSFDPYDLNEIRAYFRVLGEMTGREDFLWFATGRKKGHEPQGRNFAFKEPGIYVMRTGWSSNDSYLLVNGVQMERGEFSVHSHNDQGHAEIMIRGEDIIIDGGRFIYGNNNWKDWREYFDSTKAHNTLYVDGHRMGQVPSAVRHRGVRTYCHNFEEKELYQLIDISHNGYVYMDDPVYHRRKAIRLTGDIFVLDDQITGLGKSEHDFRLYFNFAPGDLTKDDAASWIYKSESGREYRYSSMINDGVSMSVLKGSEDPKGGWISYGYPVKVPAPQLWLSAKGPAPLRFISVISLAETKVSGKADLNRVELYFSGEKSIELKLDGEEDISVKLC